MRFVVSLGYECISALRLHRRESHGFAKLHDLASLLGGKGLDHLRREVLHLLEQFLLLGVQFLQQIIRYTLGE